jgi:hypothetical protein
MWSTAKAASEKSKANVATLSAVPTSMSGETVEETTAKLLAIVRGTEAATLNALATEPSTANVQVDVLVLQQVVTAQLSVQMAPLIATFTEQHRGHQAVIAEKDARIAEVQEMLEGSVNAATGATNALSVAATNKDKAAASAAKSLKAVR